MKIPYYLQLINLFPFGVAQVLAGLEVLFSSVSKHSTPFLLNVRTEEIPKVITFDLLLLEQALKATSISRRLAMVCAHSVEDRGRVG